MLSVPNVTVLADTVVVTPPPGLKYNEAPALIVLLVVPSVILNDVEIDDVEIEVTRPLAATVILGIAVAEP